MHYFIEEMSPTSSYFFDYQLQSNFSAGQWMCRAHSHDWIEILYCLSGNMNAMLGSQEFHFRTGDLLVIPSHEVHQIISLTDEKHEYFVIKFRPELMNMSVRLWSEYSCILPFLLHNNQNQRLFAAEELTDSEVPQIVNHFSEEYESMGYGYEIALKAEIFRLILWILRQWHKADGSSSKIFSEKQLKQLQTVLDYVNANYASPISVSDMAEICHVSYSYFSRLFSQMTGQTFTEYLNSVRLSAAERLLITTDLNITEIAFTCGFSDISYFTKRFTSKNDLSPMNYRKKYRS